MRRQVAKVMIPAWVWFFLFGERWVTVDGYYLTIRTRNLLWENTQHIRVGSEEWQEWIDRHDRFKFSNDATWCLFQKERRGNHFYWYAYKWHKSGRKSERVYVGKLARLAPKEIIAKALELERMAQFTREEIARRRKLIKRLRRRRQRRMERAREALRRRPAPEEELGEGGEE